MHLVSVDNFLMNTLGKLPVQAINGPPCPASAVLVCFADARVRYLLVKAQGDGHAKSKADLVMSVAMPKPGVKGCSYIEEGGVPPIQVLHVICNVTKDFDKEYGALFVDIRQES